MPLPEDATAQQSGNVCSVHLALSFSGDPPKLRLSFRFPFKASQVEYQVSSTSASDFGGHSGLLGSVLRGTDFPNRFEVKTMDAL